MDRELKKALTKLMRSAPGNENWTWEMAGDRLESMAEKLEENMVDTEPLFTKTVDDYFWELV